MAITGAIRGTSKEKLYQELGLETLELRRWFRKLCTFYKILKDKNPNYLFRLIPEKRSSYATRNQDDIPLIKTNHQFFKNSFFPATIIEWNQLDIAIRNSDTYGAFRNSILNFVRPSPNKVYNCHNPKGIRYITRLRLGLSHLREHKFKHCFQDSLNPLCSCGSEIESTIHYLLHCPMYVSERSILLSTIKIIDCSLLETNDIDLTRILLFGDENLSTDINTRVSNATIDYVLSTERFEDLLFLK